MRGQNRTNLILLAFVIPPVVFRITLMMEQGVGPELFDIRGFLSDFTFSFVLAVSSMAVCRWLYRLTVLRWVVIGFIVLWTVISYANYEHLKALGAVLGFHHAGFLLNETFLTGSAVAISKPILLFMVLSVSVVLGLIALYKPGTINLWPALGATSVLLAVTVFWPFNTASPGWRQVNVAHQNIDWYLNSPEFQLTAGGVRQSLPGLFPGDLDGRPLVEIRPRDHNVLLIVLESLSGAHLEQVSETHGVVARTRMPMLGAWAERNLTYTNYINHQRQTNRGMYATLCGDLPKLITASPKMSELAGWARGTLRCLPAVLRELGYETAFLQSTSLPFMAFDTFMQRIGFARVHGPEIVNNAYHRNSWGVDDRALFERAQDLVNEMDATSKPWFLTLLTSGTHHPYGVPDSFDGPYKDGSFSEAVDYLDHALDSLLKNLEQRGVLDDTLVVITSDESRGVRQQADRMSHLLWQGWGLLSVLLPTREQAVVDEPAMQMDLALSMLDYLGYPEQAAQFGGRSIFRTYAVPRMLAFGNTYKRRVGLIDPQRRLLVCKENHQKCSSYQLDSSLFSTQRTSLKPTPESVDLLRAVTDASLTATVGRYRSRTFELAVRGPTSLGATDRYNNRMIFGGQYISIPARTRVDVDLVFHLEGSAPGAVMINYRLTANTANKRLYRKRISRLDVGDRAVIRHSYYTDQALHKVEANFYAQILGKTDVTLKIDRASLRFNSIDGSQSSELDISVEREFSVVSRDGVKS